MACYNNNNENSEIFEKLFHTTFLSMEALLYEMILQF